MTTPCQIRALIVLSCALFLCSCRTIEVDSDMLVQIPDQWTPSHPQNGEVVTAVVRVSEARPTPYTDPRTGNPVFESKGLILKVEEGSRKYPPSGQWVYLASGQPLKNGSVLAVKGTLTVSSEQVEDGTHPTTIRVLDEQP